MRQDKSAPDEQQSSHSHPRKGGRTTRRGRSGRNSNPVSPSSSSMRRLIPAYQLLDEESLVSMEQQADWILKEVGVEFRGDEEALALLLASPAMQRR